MDDLKFFKYEKKKQEIDNSVCYVYYIDILNGNQFFLYDFLVYISHRAKLMYVYLHDDDMKNSKEIKIDEIEKSISEFTKNCRDNKHNVAFTYMVGMDGLGLSGRVFTVSKMWDISAISAVTYKDDPTTVPDLDLLIEKLISDYIVYTETEMLYSYLGGSSSKQLLVGVKELLEKMIEMSDDEFTAFYNKNVKWIEQHIPLIGDKFTFKTMLTDINEELGKINN